MYIYLGNFTKAEGVETVKQCILTCCENDHCNIALINDAKCYHVACVSSDLCMPILSPMPDSERHVGLILVKPVSTDETW